MKKIKVIIVLAVLLAVLSACGNTSGNVDAVTDQADPSVQSENEINTDEAEGEETAHSDDQQDDLTSKKTFVYFTSDISAEGLVRIVFVMLFSFASGLIVNIIV